MDLLDVIFVLSTVIFRTLVMMFSQVLRVHIETYVRNLTGKDLEQFLEAQQTEMHTYLRFTAHRLLADGTHPHTSSQKENMSGLREPSLCSLHVYPEGYLYL